MAEYREIFEKLPDGITLHDAADGSILETNQQFCEMVGYTREELLDLDFGALHVDEPPYTSDRAEEYIRKAATEGPQTFEWLDETKDGEALPVEVHLRRTTIDGDPRILAVVRDITGRRERERALERKNERLDEFASVVSHDLQNPLSVAQGRIELAREEYESDHLGIAAEAVDRSLELVDDLLALAREGGEVLDAESVELAPLARSCWRGVETTDATLVVETDRVLRADAGRLRQLLENLMRNAVAHGGADVTVTVGDVEDGFFVADDGTGIPPDVRERMFDQGYSTAQEGTGFGLNIVRSVAEGHGWDLSVTESEQGGARFEVTGVESDGSEHR